MNKLDIEKTIKEIHTLRSQKNDLAKHIKEKVDNILSHMRNVNKRALRTPDYSVERITRIRRNMDFEGLDTLLDQGIIPKQYIIKAEYERLLISTHKNMKLVKGKWVTED